MLDIAASNQSYIDRMKRSYIQGDFEVINDIKPHIQGSTLICMLGNTITNVCNLGRYLQSFSNILNDTDVLLLGVELSDTTDIKDILAEYQTPENYTLTFRPLAMLGVSLDSGDIDIRRNPDLSRIEEWFIFERSCVLSGFNIPAGTKVLLSVTQKPSSVCLIEQICKAGLCIVEIYKQENQYILLIQKNS